MDLTQALYTTRAMRRVRTDPIPTQVVQSMLDAAIRAPSGGNSQIWRFVVVTDPEVRAAVGTLYQDAFAILMERVYGQAVEKARQEDDQGTLRIVSSAKWLADNASQVPLWLFFYARGDPSGASIYPAVWSAMLAARGHDVGTCLTTILGEFKAEETDELLGTGHPQTRSLRNVRRSMGQPRSLAGRRAVVEWLVRKTYFGIAPNSLS